MRLSRRGLLGMMAGAGAELLGKTVPALAQTAAQRMPAGENGEATIAPGPFKGTRASLESYEVPEWYRDAKFGIWAHWGPQSAIEAGDWYARNMYLQDSEQYNYHVQRFGHPSKCGFKDTIPAWKAEKFDPSDLTKLYKKAGAKYFMSMGVHHDNFDLWNSRYNSWNSVQMGPHKDIVGMWHEAARNEGLRFGVSEHLWISYKWFSVNHGSDRHGPLAGVPYDGADPRFKDFYIDSDQTWTSLENDWNESGIPAWWKQHWFRRIKDLLDHYELDLLYTDGALPFEDLGYNAVAHLYNLSARRSGGKVEAVYFSKRDADSQKGVCVLDRERGVLNEISERPWQTDTCIGDWHYKLGVKYKTTKRVIDMLVDIVSRNGNLLLNFPLPASGALDLEEREILAGITEWMAVNGEAIFATRPWKTSGEGPSTNAAATSSFNENKRQDLTAADVRFTTKGPILYAFVMGWPDFQAHIQALALDTALRVGKIENVELLGDQRKLTWQQTREGLAVELPREAPARHAVVFKITGAL